MDAPNAGEGLTEAPRIYSADADHVVASWRSVLFTCWRSKPRAEQIRITRRANADIFRVHPSGVRVFNVLEGAMGVPDPEGREASAQVMKETRDEDLCSATIVLSTGFWGSTVRAVLTTITLFASPGYPAKVFDSVEAAVRWMASVPAPDGVTEAELARAVAPLRALHRGA